MYYVWYRRTELRHILRRLHLMFRTTDCHVDCRWLRHIRCQLSLITRGLCPSLTTTKHSATKVTCLCTTPRVSSVTTAPRTRASRRYSFETCKRPSSINYWALNEHNTATDSENVIRLDIYHISADIRPSCLCMCSKCLANKTFWFGEFSACLNVCFIQ